MKPAPFEYVRASSVEDATRALVAANGTAMVLGGGQSLMPLMALRVTAAELLVDIGRIAGLGSVTATPDSVRIGAGVTHAQIEDKGFADRITGPTGDLMRRVAAGIAYRAVRNHGTIGGSLALADPAADWPICLLALGASVRIAGPAGERVEPVGGFLRGAYQTSLRTGEIIVAFDVPLLPIGYRVGYDKVVRKSGAFAMSAACAVRAADGSRAVVALGGTTTRAVLLAKTAQLLARPARPTNAELRAAIADDLAAQAPDADAYQHRLHAATVLRAIQQAQT